MSLSILYRGPLESCNYGCAYCPFAKKEDDRETLAEDRRALERFVAWCTAREKDRLSVLFTPWGEALIRPHYQEALAHLSHLGHVDRVAIQTNLSGSLAWVARANPATLALWTTYHPEWTSRDRFVEKVRELDARGVGVSCGVVGFRRFAREIEALREALPSHVYVWINAVKSGGEEGKGEPYDEETLARFVAVDPHFSLNAERHPSLGRACVTGHRVISVAGDGTVRRCHFVRAPIGNLYDPSFEECLRPRPCPNDTCGCHIGYVHLEELGLHGLFGAGLLERIPDEPRWRRRSLPVVG